MPPYVADVRKPLREEKPATLQPLVPLGQRSIDLRRERTALDRLLAVGLHEHEQNVLAAQAGQELVGRRAGDGVVLDLGGEHAPVVDVRPNRVDLVNDQTGGERRGDRRVGNELSAERRAECPHSSEPRDRPQRPAAVLGRNPGQPQHGQRQQDGQYDGADNRADLDQLRLRTTDQGAQRLDPVPELTRVSERVVRPVVEGEHLVIDDLQDDHQSEGQSCDHGHDASRCAGQDEGQRDQDEQLEREPQEPGQLQILRLVRSDEGRPHEDSGEDREHDGDALTRAPMSVRGSVTGVGRSGVRGTRSGESGVREAGAGVGINRHRELRPRSVVPQPPHVAAERLGQRGEGDHQERPRHGRRQDLGGRDGQHDPLHRGHGLAPVARRQLRAQPRQRPAGGEEHVACRTDREHPGACEARDVHAEDKDEERVDLSVEDCAHLRRPGAPGHPSVDRVEHERNRGERHQQRDRDGVAERVRHQHRHADGERRPHEGDAVGGAQARSRDRAVAARGACPVPRLLRAQTPCSP